MFSSVATIRRDEIPAIFEVEQNGKKYILGEHRDFRRHNLLANFLPAQARLAISWVHLEPEQVLEPHVHPIDSMILVCRGQGKLLGQINTDLAEGDTVIVPSGCEHGFQGSYPQGISALSIQFEEQGLYENPEKPLVKFSAESEWRSLINFNSHRLANHLQHSFFQMLTDGTLENLRQREMFFDCLQAWSSHFQTLIFARQSACADDKYQRMFLQHLQEEIGHDLLLAAEREPKKRLWDATIEATASWFISRMLVLDNIEKTAIVHLVLETSASEFHSLAKNALARFGKLKYFDIHAEVDCEHVELGTELLKNQTHQTYSRLKTVIEQAWDMLDTMLERMTELVYTAQETGKNV